MDNYIILLLLVSIVNIVTSRSLWENYYWRDYKGVIPTDALPAGQDIKGQPIYIGQVLEGGKLIPGKIYENDENIYYEYGEQARSTNKNIKILCTDNAENFKWVPTTIEGVLPLRYNTNLLKGGYEPGLLTFIGRVQHGGRTELGKVMCYTTIRCLALYNNENGQEIEYHKFEILTYNGDIENAIIK